MVAEDDVEFAKEFLRKCQGIQDGLPPRQYPPQDQLMVAMIVQTLYVKEAIEVAAERVADEVYRQGG